MMRSLYSGITGLKAHQTKMDVIGNNISNVNTIGFKKSTTTFKDLFSQTSSYASAPTGQIGGINAQQIGLGTQVGDIRIMHTPGAAQYTGNPLDFCIEGDGFFIIETPEGARYTRAGNFGLDFEGSLVTADGNYVMGFPTTWQASTPADNGPDGQPGTDDDIPPVYGKAVVDAAYDGSIGGMMNPDANGRVPGRIKIDTDMFYQFSVDQTGVVYAQLKNEATDAEVAQALGLDNANPPAVTIPKGTKIAIGYVATGTFTNPSGLEKQGGNNYIESANSGNVEIGHPGDQGFGKLIGSSKEMSNVDLSEEMVDMIVTQRGFQANSRIITVSDTILEELINLKR